MEEDAGKLVHAGSDRLAGSAYSLVDFNRAGVPLLEIVSEPDIRTGEEAAEYGQELRRIVRYLGISDGNMQEGSLRCDVNVSVRPVGQEKFGVKVEIKNMNSFSAIHKAIDYEIQRQIEALENGEPIVQETRLWEEGSQRTISMRSKEGSSDYRYFPEPDLPPIELSSQQLAAWKSELPELAAAKRQRYQTEYGLSAYDARVLTDDREIAEYFEAAVGERSRTAVGERSRTAVGERSRTAVGERSRTAVGERSRTAVGERSRTAVGERSRTAVAAKANPKQVANWLTQDIAAYLNNNKLKVTEIALTADILAELVNLISEGTISGKIGKEILPELLTKGGSARELVEKKGLVQISDADALGKIIDEVIEAHPEELEKYRNGKTKLKGFFVGQVMKKSGGRADPKLTNQLLSQKLG